MQSTSRALLTDLYQLTMGQAYFELGMDNMAVFELFARRLPRTRRFLIAAGLAQAIEYLEQLRFEPADLEYLASLGTFKPDFLDHLSKLRFTGSVHAMREGTPFFADEPILRITAPILEAQLIESRILNIVHFQTLIASKAARCVLAARGRQLVDFGMRRAHEGDAALYAARAAYLAGFHATATVEAGRRFGIPLSGTMAHSFIEAHEREADAFRNFVMYGPTADATMLIDTYDTQRGARRVGILVQELRKSRGLPRVGAVRIDSGDLANEAKSVRSILDQYDCDDIRIVLSGNLDEHVIDGLIRNGVPADAFGVGTALDVSADAPALDVAYKLQQYGGKPRRKRSFGKATWPGTKQVFRERGEQNQIVGDRVALVDEKASGEPLLIPLLDSGRRVGNFTSLSESRQHCARELQALPWPLRELGEAGEGGGFPVVISDALRALAASVDSREV